MNESQVARFRSNWLLLVTMLACSSEQKLGEKAEGSAGGNYTTTTASGAGAGGLAASGSGGVIGGGTSAVIVAGGGWTSLGGGRYAGEGGVGVWAAGNAGASTQVPYCRTESNSGGPRVQCAADFCAALNSALALSDGGTFIFSGAEVRAGRCAAPGDAFDAVYFGTGVGSDRCYYRAGALVGTVTWGDTTAKMSNGCTIFRGPVVWGEFPDSALTEYLNGCPGLTTYREMRSFVAGTAGTAGVPNGPELGNCYQVATATCGPC